MQKAQQRDGARINKYPFRRAVFPANTPNIPGYDMSSRPVSPPLRSSGLANGHHKSSAPNTPLTHSRSPSATASGVGAGVSSPRPTRLHNGYSRDPHARASSTHSTCSSPVEEEEAEIVEMTIDEIINGRGDYPGLMGLVNAYLNSVNVDLATKCELRRYLDLIKYRAKGQFPDPLFSKCVDI
jgi:glutamate--cysteine ligase catalytic subunit